MSDDGSTVPGMDHLAHIRSESQRLADVLAAVDPLARVPTCPDWAAADLLWHLTEVHDHWTTIVRDRLDDPDPAEAVKPDRPATVADLLRLREATTAALLDVLADTPDDVAVWTWAARPADRNVGFVRRFQVHEALMHRIDAELTAGSVPSPIDPQVATDGVDVVLDFTHSWRPGWATWEPSGSTGRLRTTDTGRSWIVQVGTFSGTAPDGSWSCDHEPALALLDDGEPAFEVSAPAADLDAWLWNRPGFGQVHVEGSQQAFEQLRAKVSGGTP